MQKVFYFEMDKAILICVHSVIQSFVDHSRASYRVKA